MSADTANQNSQLARGNRAFMLGDYEAACRLYEGVSAVSPSLGKYVQFNLQLARRRLNRIQEESATPRSTVQLGKKSQSSPQRHKVDDASGLPQISLENAAPMAEEYVLQSYADFKGAKAKPVGLKPSQFPLVSVVVTTYNAADSIQHCIESLLNQSYPNIEIIVCDDASTDDTWRILQSMRHRSANCLRIHRLNINSGTYLAKNVCIASANGEIVMFQDSDDYSHPERVMIQSLELMHNPKSIGNRTMYLRYREDTGRVTPVAGLNSKFGFITLAVRRRAFEEIGYFDSVRRAGDDEWFQRLSHLYGKAAIGKLDVTLYLARLSTKSLAADIITANDDGSLNQNLSPDRQVYQEQFRSNFSDSAKGREWYRSNFPVYPLRATSVKPKSIMAFAEVSCPVVVSLCSIPSREVSLSEVVGRLLPQVDRMYVFLDKYESVPKFLTGNPHIVVRRSQEFPVELRDNAKFLAFNDLKREFGSFYYLTCDDDIVYPHDYVRALISRLMRYENSVVVGLHGVVCAERTQRYYRERFNYSFEKADMSMPRLVNNMGTGTVAFHSSVLTQINPFTWRKGGMVDILFSKECLSAGVPMVCIERRPGWLQTTKQSVGTPTLFDEFSKQDQVIGEELQALAPWGYQAIAKTLQRFTGPIRDELEAALPKFSAQLQVSQFFDRYRG